MTTSDSSIAGDVPSVHSKNSDSTSAANKAVAEVNDFRNKNGAEPRPFIADAMRLSQQLHQDGVLPVLDIIGDTPPAAGNVSDQKQPAGGDVNNGLVGLFGDGSKDGGQLGRANITKDEQGRIINESRRDGSKSQFSYNGDEKQPNKIQTTNADGSGITFEKGPDGQWSQTTTPADHGPSTTRQIDSVHVTDTGNISVKDGTVSQIYGNDGNRTAIAATDHGFLGIPQFTKTNYSYNAKGELISVNRESPDGNTERLNRNPDGQWERHTAASGSSPEVNEKVTNVTGNSDGGFSYDKGADHVVQDGKGGRHVKEQTAYGSYEQAFDPHGTLTSVVRTDNASGKAELVQVLPDGKASVLIYDTKHPESYSTANGTVNADGSYSYKDSSGKEIKRTADLSPDGLNQAPLDPEAAKLAKQNGLDVKREVKDGKLVYEYTVSVMGHEQTVLSTDKPPKEAADQLKALRDEKMAMLEKDYNARISRDGDVVKDINGHDAAAKAPNLGQLLGVEGALQRSQPDDKTSDGKPLQIQFLVNQDNPNVGGFADGHRVVIEPNGGQDAGATAVESLFLHELAHQGQDNLYGNDKHLEDQYAGRLGFVRAGDDWLLIGKDGSYYKSNPGAGGVGSADWTRTDKDGNSVDKDGKRSDRPQIISNDEARNVALIKPSSDYFPNPAEAGAEATRLFRGGETSRTELYRTSPSSYAAIKELDQLDLNKMYGLDKDGQPRYIRNADGIPVQNTQENRTQVAMFEQMLTNPVARTDGLARKAAA